MVHCGDELLGTEEINNDIDKIIGYEGPITRIYEDIAHQFEEQEEGIYMHTISQAVGYAVDKEELIKALQYDRNQYEKGYKDAISVIEGIKAEIESNMEDIIGKYDSSVPKAEMPSYKLERNKVRKECIDIIDKHVSGIKNKRG